MERGTGGFINPQKVVAQLPVSEGMKIADFGCGHGYFTIPLAKIVGNDGRIWAVDILSDPLEAVRSWAQLENITNIETVRGNLETSGASRLPDNAVDMVLLHNVLFESPRKSDIIQEARRVLKNNGNFILVDWLPEKLAIGPQNNLRLPIDQARQLAQEQEFSFVKNFDAGKYHYGLIFIKP